MHNLDRPPVYHGPATLTPALVDLLCTMMAQAVISYNELAYDIARDKLDDEFDTFVDFDHYSSYCVADVRTDFNRAEHRMPPGYTGLIVCYDLATIAEVPTLDDGRDLISLGCGRQVVLIAEHTAAERCWLPEPLTGGPRTPETPPPPSHLAHH